MFTNDWEDYLSDAEGYLRAAHGKNGNPPKLGSDIRYNLLAISLEKSIMAIHLYRGDLADNHTFGDLIDSVARHIEIPEEVRTELLKLEQTQTICNIFEYHREIPAETTVDRLDKIAQYLFERASLACRMAA
jgi:hypothetical protein